MNFGQPQSLEIATSPGRDQNQYIRRHIQSYIKLKDKYYWICFSSIIYFGFRILMWIIGFDNARHTNESFNWKEIGCAAFGMGTVIINLLFNRRPSKRLKYSSILMNVLLLAAFLLTTWPAFSAAFRLNCDVDNTSLQAQCFRQRWGLVMTLIVQLAGLLITFLLMFYCCKLVSLGDEIKDLTGDDENIIPNAFVPLEEDEEENA